MITPPSVRWHELGQQPASRVMTATQLFDGSRVLSVKVPGEATFTIERSDPIVASADARSYAKVLRVTVPEPGVVELTVESWCYGCKATAILWGESELPVFVPKITVYDERAQPVSSTGELRRQDPLWRNIPFKGTWRFEAIARGPYYVVITSSDSGGTHIGFAGNIASYVSSPIGKIRVKTAAP
jgi:hypothetical protein